MSTLPFSAVKAWKDMFLAALLVHTNTSPVAVWIATYCEGQDREFFYSFAVEGNPHGTVAEQPDLDVRVDPAIGLSVHGLRTQCGSH